jgi:hypothetical protein
MSNNPEHTDRPEPTAGAAFIAALEAAAKQLSAEIADLRAERTKAQRLRDQVQLMTNLEFMKRCIDCGIDKHTIEELQDKLAKISEERAKVVEVA